MTSGGRVLDSTGSKVVSLHVVRSESDAGIERLLSHTKDPEFARSPQIQSLVVRRVATLWSGISPGQQEVLTRAIAPHLPRCLESPDPLTCFSEIVQLSRLEDIDRALMVRSELYDNWVGTDEERLYPTKGFIGNYLRAMKCSVVPLGFHFWSAVVLIGAVLKRNLYYEGGSYRVWPHWYVVLAGDKATGKGAALEAMMDVLQRFNALCGPATDEQARLKRIHLFPNNVTIEYMMDELAELCEERIDTDLQGMTLRQVTRRGDAAALLALGEMGTFFGKDNWAADQRPMFLTDIKESDFYSQGTRSKGRKDLYNLAVSMLGCCAPVWLRSVITPEMTSGGTSDRTTYVFRHPVFDRMLQYPPGRVPPRDPLALNLLAKQLTAVAGLNKTPTMLTDEATEFMAHINQQLVTEKRMHYELTQGQDESGSILRTVNNVVRLGMILAVSDGLVTENELVIERRHIELGWRLLKLEDDSLEQFLQFRGVGGADAQAEGSLLNRMKVWIAKYGGCCSVSEISNKFTRQAGGYHMVKQRFLPRLIEEGAVTKHLVKRGKTSKSEVYRLIGHEVCVKCTED